MMVIGYSFGSLAVPHADHHITRIDHAFAFSLFRREHFRVVENRKGVPGNGLVTNWLCHDGDRQTQEE